MKEFQEQVYPELEKQIRAQVGDGVQIEVDWDTLAADNYAHLYNDAFTKVYFTPLIGALTAICTDEMGKEALQETLKTIVIRNSSGIYSESSCFTFEAGTLTFDHDPISNVDYSERREKALVEMLEKNL